MNFADVKEWRIPEGDVIRVTDSHNVVIWEKNPIDPKYYEPFYVENINNNNETLSIVQSSSYAYDLTIECSTNKIDWETLGTTSTTAITRTITPGSKLYLRCNTNSWGSTNTQLAYNNITGVSKVGGNILSLIWGGDFVNHFEMKTTTYVFYQIFYMNTTLKDTSSLLLPSTVARSNSYDGMFYGCTSLLNTPELPATTLHAQCYEKMFAYCRALTTAPVLASTSLGLRCYYDMFWQCTNLVNAPVLPATTLVEECYAGMFRACTKLTTAPDLLATDLVTECYYQMFSGCTKLNSVKCLATNGINQNRSTLDWLRNVSSTGTFTKAAGTTWSRNSSGIPSNWTVVEQ